MFRPIESFAEATLATEGGYPADARATEPTTVLLVPKNDFVDLLRGRPELALRMLGSMSQHLRVIVGLLDDLTLKDMETRLANWLLKQCPRPVSAAQVEIKLDRTKRVLAAEMGTTSETLSRTLAKFRDRKLLHVKGNDYREASRPIAETASTTPGRTIATAVRPEIQLRAKPFRV